MLKKASITVIVFALGLILGKNLFSKTPMVDTNSEFTESIRQKLQAPDADLSKVFLLLLANMGLSLQERNAIVILEKSEYEDLGKQIVNLTQKLEASKQEAMKASMKQVELAVPAMPEVETPPPPFSLNLNTLFSELKKSYTLVRPIYIDNGQYNFIVDKNVYSDRYPVYAVKMEMDLTHTGHYFKGNIKIELTDGQKVLHTKTQKGVNKDLLLVGENNVAIQIEKYLITFQLSKDFDRREKHSLNLKSGELYFLGDRRPIKMGHLNLLD
ncbi:hypothetical protein [Bacteriovorax sp. Seq25_V]|uniref:hypothetical protein n=1 Tax=Bacteriovorax sp. Seq25_V TaxID=1201288 RepID=UPI0004017AF4|nr:hypothetical protein [Bacteriovorax sp. Seq25_V]